MRTGTLFGLAMTVLLTGCADWHCFTACEHHTQNSTSLVEFLYPNGAVPPAQGVQRLYGIDLMALVSYDQVGHEDDNNWSLGYLTIVGAYVLKGTRHDISTLVDLAVVDPATHSLVLRAGGFDTRHGTVALINEQRSLREAATEGFTAATGQMIEHFDGALTAFESDVKEGKANIHVVSNQRGSGGVGALDGCFLLALLSLALLPLAARRLRLVPTAKGR